MGEYTLTFLSNLFSFLYLETNIFTSVFKQFPAFLFVLDIFLVLVIVVRAGKIEHGYFKQCVRTCKVENDWFNCMCTIVTLE